jgi:hypothetical protein
MIGWCRECKTNPVQYTHYRGVPFGLWCRVCAGAWAASGQPIPRVLREGDP